MQFLHHSDLLIDADAVLRGQGADPAIIRARKPQLVGVAEDAIREAAPLMKPVVAYTQLDVVGRSPDRIELAGGAFFSGEQVARLLAQAEHVIAAVITIGRDL